MLLQALADALAAFQDAQGQIGIAQGLAPQVIEAGLDFRRQMAESQFLAHVGDDIRSLDVFCRAADPIADEVDETVDFRVIRHGRRRHLHDSRKDEGMQAVGNDRIHTAHEGHEFHRRIVAVEDDGFRLHAAGNVTAGFDVGRVLHGDEDDVDVLCFLQLVSSSGNGVLIGFMVLPVADGNAQAPADAGDAVFLEDIEADILVDGMHGQDHVGAIFTSNRSGRYNSMAWAIVYYMDRAVQSLNTVISIVSTLLYF